MEFGLTKTLGKIRDNLFTKKGAIVLVILVVIVDLFFIVKCRDKKDPYDEQIKKIDQRIDSIKAADSKRQVVIDSLEIRKQYIDFTIDYLHEDNEKIDSLICVGDWDYNVWFLSDYLSRNGEGHGYLPYQESTYPSEPGIERLRTPKERSKPPN